MKYLAIFFALMFILFAAFQYNDPDPQIWMPLYGYAALISILVAFDQKNNFLIISGIIVYIIGIIYFWPDTFKGMGSTMTMMNKEVEQARESLGLSICLIVFLIYLFLAKRK